MDLWTRIFRIALHILGVGTLLGIAADLWLGRELRKEELGILVWPLTGLYLLSFFYVATFLVLTSVKSPLRYVVVPLWCLTLVLMLMALLFLIFTKDNEILEPAGSANESLPVRSK